MLVCDQSTTYQRAQRLLGVTVKEPYFFVNERKYFFLYDPPHLIKSIRNNLHNTGFRVGLKEATWKVIVDFFTLDQQSQTGLRMAPKLSKDHIQLKPFSKMRVSLATQVLSNSVSKGIKSAIKTGDIVSARSKIEPF